MDFVRRLFTNAFEFKVRETREMGLETSDAPREANIFHVPQPEKQREGRRHPFIQRKHIKVNGKSQKK